MAEVTTDRSWINQALAETNLERANHGVPALLLNEELVRISQHWANRLANFHKKMVHTKVAKEFEGNVRDVSCGENIYVYQAGNKAQVKDGAIPVRSWYDEIYDYDYQTGVSKNGKKVGHFTQSVWKSTLQVGFALSINAEGQNFVVATYQPPGNWEGEYIQNVLLPKGILAPIPGVQKTSNSSGPRVADGEPLPTLQLLTQPSSVDQKTAPPPPPLPVPQTPPPSQQSHPGTQASPPVQQNLLVTTLAQNSPATPLKSQDISQHSIAAQVPLAAVPQSQSTAPNSLAANPSAPQILQTSHNVQPLSGGALPPCVLPRPYKGKWRPVNRKRVCNRALNDRMESSNRLGSGSG